jgi:hypothetical protein
MCWQERRAAPALPESLGSLGTGAFRDAAAGKGPRGSGTYFMNII